MSNPDYRYNILVLPNQISNLDDQQTIYFQPKPNIDIMSNSFVNESTAPNAKLRLNVDNSTVEGDFREQTFFQTNEQILDNQERSYHHEELYPENNKHYPEHNDLYPKLEELDSEKHEELDSEYKELNPKHKKLYPKLGEVHQDLEHKEPYPEQPISYAYNYNVNDSPNGPIFSKQENSDGFLTRGEYR